MIEKIKELVGIPSITSSKAEGDMPYGRDVKRALDYVLNLCDELGFETKNCENHLGYAQIGRGEELIGILCHLDVVPAGKDWIHDPFGGEIEDGKLYGRGVSDDKGPAIAAIYAMKDILDSGIELDKRIRIIFGCQEEDGDWLDMEYYKAHEEIPSYGFTPDADFPAIYGEKGILMLDLSMSRSTARGIEINGGEAANMVADHAVCQLKNLEGNTITLEQKGRSAHGSTPWDGENAISKLMEQLYTLDAQEKIICPLARFYMEKLGFDLHGESIDCHLKDEPSGELSLNVGMIRTDEQSVKLSIDIRYPVTYSASTVTERITESVKHYGVLVTVASQMNPVYMDKDGMIIKTLMSAYKDVTGDDTKPMVMGGGTYARAMENIVAFGPMLPGRECTEHQRDEYLYIEDLEKARKIYKLALERLLTL